MSSAAAIALVIAVVVIGGALAFLTLSRNSDVRGAGALSGEIKADVGQISFLNQDIGHLPPDARRTLGICAAPEERMGHAAAPDMSLYIEENFTAVLRQKLRSGDSVAWFLIISPYLGWQCLRLTAFVWRLAAKPGSAE